MKSISLAELESMLRSSPELAKEAIAAVSQEIEVIAVADVRQRLNQGLTPEGTPFAPLAFPRPQGGNKPLQNTGILAASVSASCTESELILRANAPGARLQQEGGIVRPVKAKALAIPLTKEAVRAGSPRNFTAGRLFPFKSAKGGGLATQDEKPGKRGKYGTKVKAKITVHYIFRASVTIPERRYLGLSEAARGRIAGVIGSEMRARAFNKFTGG